MPYSMNLLVKVVVFYVSPGKNAVFDESPRENGFLSNPLRVKILVLNYRNILLSKYTDFD